MYKYSLIDHAQWDKNTSFFFIIVVKFDGPTSSSDFKAHSEKQAGE